ncbi:MAG TPA: hypothetical protein VFC00_05135 [Micromonosporaceae bacterium]|nr:hypothetical protein [Micromonosporaceae bacterium]
MRVGQPAQRLGLTAPITYLPVQAQGVVEVRQGMVELPQFAAGLAEVAEIGGLATARSELPVERQGPTMVLGRLRQPPGLPVRVADVAQGGGLAIQPSDPTATRSWRSGPR